MARRIEAARQRVGQSDLQEIGIRVSDNRGEMPPRRTEITGIVADFHDAAEADAAREAFDREVRQGLEPADTETVPAPASAVSDRGIRIDKLIAAVGLAESNTDATRKVKSGAVEINNVIFKDLVITDPPAMLVLRVGKKWKRVSVAPIPRAT